MQFLPIVFLLTAFLAADSFADGFLPDECQDSPVAEILRASQHWPNGSVSKSPLAWGHRSHQVHFALRRRGSEAVVLTRTSDWRSGIIVAWNFHVVFDLLRRVASRWPQLVSDVDLVISAGDFPMIACPEERLYPCFGFCAPSSGAGVQSDNVDHVIGWPNPYFLRYGFNALEEIPWKRDLPNADAVPWSERRNRIYWRGALAGPDEELDIDNFSRVRLLKLAERHPDIFDVGIVDIDESTPAIEKMGKRVARKRYGRFLKSHEDFQQSLPRFKYSLSVDGVAAAWRGRELFASGAVVLLQQGPWTEFFQPSLEPWVHFVPVQADLSDLPQHFAWLEAHPEAAEGIAAAGRAFGKTRLDPRATECYALAALQFLANAAGYTPMPESDLSSAGFRGTIGKPKRNTGKREL